jgi:hypothetical protein
MPSRPKKRKRKKPAKRRAKPRLPWVRRSDDAILDMRLCDLGLRIQGTQLDRTIERVREELVDRDIRIRPYFWLSDDWFTPEGYTGTAIPFFLAHPRLQRLERNQTGEVEGGTESWCLKLMRHEVGHVVDHAFQLHKKRCWHQQFGRSSRRYPRFYRPNPHSKRFVQHLEYWYAQSHPDEDFAETFAVWLTPRSGWRRRYNGWPALRKLEVVDKLMDEIEGKKPQVRTRTVVDSLPNLRRTLREHYAWKRSHGDYGVPALFDRDLRRLFTAKRKRGVPAASTVIRQMRSDVVRMVAPWTGDNPYLLQHVIKDMITRCRELRLYAQGARSRIKKDFTILLTKHVMNSVYRRRRWVEM